MRKGVAKMDIKKIAEHILSVADQSGKSITNLQLQKVLFFTFGMAIRHDINELEYFQKIYDNDFEKWRYGPVVPSLYFNFNIYGNRKIEDTGKYNEELSRFDELIQSLLRVDVYRLVALSHQMKAWSDYEGDILRGNRIEPYTLEEIVRDFKDA